MGKAAVKYYNRAFLPMKPSCQCQLSPWRCVKSLRPALTSSYEGSYIFGYAIQPINPLNNDQTPKHSATRQK